MSSKGAKTTVPAVNVVVTGKDGREHVMTIEEAAHRLGTTAPTVKSWCIGEFNPPKGIMVRYQHSTSGMTETQWRRPMSERGKRMYEAMKARRRKELLG